MNTLDRIAADIMFTGKVDLAKYGLMYRKGKTIADVEKARAKALKNGRSKIEHELGMLSLYLGDVFKTAKVPK